MSETVDILIPDLGLAEKPLVISAWLVELGSHVHQGDRLLEVHAGEVTVDVSAPASGVLSEQRLSEYETVTVGQCVGTITPIPPTSN